MLRFIWDKMFLEINHLYWKDVRPWTTRPTCEAIIRPLGVSGYEHATHTH